MCARREHIRYGAFWACPLTGQGGRFDDDGRFIDDIPAFDHLALLQSGPVAGLDRRVPFGRCPRYRLLTWWRGLRRGTMIGEDEVLANELESEEQVVESANNLDLSRQD